MFNLKKMERMGKCEYSGYFLDKQKKAAANRKGYIILKSNFVPTIDITAPGERTC